MGKDECFRVEDLEAMDEAIGDSRTARRMERATQDQKPSDSQMRAMIDQACEDLGRHGLQPTDEAAQVVLNLIASASELGRLVRLRNEPSAVEAKQMWAYSELVVDNLTAEIDNDPRETKHDRLAYAQSRAKQVRDFLLRLTHSTEEA